MKHVKATRMSVVKQVPISELGKVALEGEEFDCTENRFIWLSGHNKYHSVFAVEVPGEVVTKKGKK